ncbi:hypothetical protein ABIG06_006269 [Bradyrhizobium sp. USDA 326]|uniref:hypothetical protein n=1 Tax=unclassified Bradyrhizobium TaxID=2631580 RepID=UPI003514ED3E
MSITEILAQIRAPDFTAGIVLFDDVVVETAPIVRYMRRWSRERVREECRKRGWSVTVVWQMEREDVTAPQIKSGITQHEESFEAVRPTGETEFFYFDENANRRAINGRLSKERAFELAQAFLTRKA